MEIIIVFWVVSIALNFAALVDNWLSTFNDIDVGTVIWISLLSLIPLCGIMIWLGAKISDTKVMNKVVYRRKDN